MGSEGGFCHGYRLQQIDSSVIYRRSSHASERVLDDLDRFGSARISDELIARMEAIIQKPVHHFIRRGIFFSHR
jgi:hypothetical protein